MRALCGSIIAAGAFIGLGLTSIGIGNRFATTNKFDTNGNLVIWHWQYLDQPLLLILVVLLCAVVIGLAIAFIGLAYHHERRHHEKLHALAHPTEAPRIHV